MTWGAVMQGLYGVIDTRFGETVTYSFASGAPSIFVTVVMDYDAQQVGDDLQVVTWDAVAHIRRESGIDPRRGDTVEVEDGTVYQVEGETTARDPYSIAVSLVEI